ncbi:MAG TPA: NAD(P)H-dependent oxidoreductase subunit E [Candidatus Aminicenantes bacterium]|nr:NAD(P)H-dependent oxidoreductase subunit E [Candidatus Aminicenantes bacterium]HRY64715.1 NAD(P)H-dependent oxidoreductase subunit E [Candidatus Aminicenantes bacterium]HRZ71628.1 NAD(P)H-dependent oxidoreductase subunit E [Candidatus Aminicenantes bacterium]
MRPPTSELEALTAKYRGRRQALIQVLQDIQDRFHWLPPEALERVAADLGVPLVQVYGVATFYRSFSLRPQGRHTCVVCLGTACHVRGGQAVLEGFERRLGVGAGQTTPDGAYTLERVNCLGACALAPLAVVDGRYHARMTEAKVGAVLAEAEEAGKA